MVSHIRIGSRRLSDIVGTFGILSMENNDMKMTTIARDNIEAFSQIGYATSFGYHLWHVTLKVEVCK